MLGLVDAGHARVHVGRVVLVAAELVHYLVEALLWRRAHHVPCHRCWPLEAAFLVVWLEYIVESVHHENLKRKKT